MCKINDAHEINEEFICSTKREEKKTFTHSYDKEDGKEVGKDDNIQCHERKFSLTFEASLFTHIRKI